eukprot:6181737-Pleurochrysis_carterae.AAC.3
MHSDLPPDSGPTRGASARTVGVRSAAELHRGTFEIRAHGPASATVLFICACPYCTPRVDVLCTAHSYAL